MLLANDDLSSSGVNVARVGDNIFTSDIVDDDPVDPGFQLALLVAGIPNPVVVSFANRTLVNGVNDDVLPGEVGSRAIVAPLRIMGPTLAYSITSFANPVNGRRIVVVNGVASALTIVHEAGTGTAANRIKTQTAANVVLAQFQTIELIYNPTIARWLQL